MKNAEEWCPMLVRWQAYALEPTLRTVREIQVDVLRHAADICQQELGGDHIAVCVRLIQEAEELEAK